jgi:iron complex transport system substrate-binding protein
MFARRLTLLALFCFVLAACGGAPVAQQPTTAPAPTDAPAPASAPAATEPPAATTAPQASAACAAGQRLFDHPLLATEPVCVPAAAERIVSLEPSSHDLLMALGRPPVAAIGYLDGVLAASYPELSFAANGITDLGFPPNLELLVAAQPDLIISSDANAESVSYEQLSAIAPTVVFTGGPSGEWKSWLDGAAAALGLEAELAERFAAYEARLQAFRETVGDPAAIEVSVVRVQPDDQVMMNLVNSFPSVVVADAGLGRPESQRLDAAAAQERYGSEIGAMISLEQAQLADADLIFVWGAQPSAEQQAAAEERWQALNANPVWASLSAVQAGDVHRVGSHWVGWGLHAAHAVLDDLFRHVAGVDPASVAPNPLGRSD